MNVWFVDSKKSNICSDKRRGRWVEEMFKRSGWLKDESFVVQMLNELENTIELLWLWKLLWGHHKLAPVWELACWQKRGFVWKAPSEACSHWDPHSSIIARSMAWQELQHFFSYTEEASFLAAVLFCLSLSFLMTISLGSLHLWKHLANLKLILPNAILHYLCGIQKVISIAHKGWCAIDCKKRWL